MVDDGLWPIIKAAIEWLVLPLTASVAYFFRKYVHRVEHLERQVNAMEIRLAVVEANIVNIKEDLEEIKKGIDKILDKL